MAANRGSNRLLLIYSRCKEQTEHFKHKQPYDTSDCFELMQHAYKYLSNEALDYIHDVYEPLVIAWVVQHPAFAATGEKKEDFAHRALQNFYYSARGERFDKFNSLEHALAFLKKCVHSAVLQYFRDQRRIIIVEIESLRLPYDVSFDDNLQFLELWAHICTVLPNGEDQLLAYLRLVLQLKPSEIMDLCNRVQAEVSKPSEMGKLCSRFENEQDISNRIYIIREKLRNDELLRQRSGARGKAKRD